MRRHLALLIVAVALGGAPPASTAAVSALDARPSAQPARHEIESVYGRLPLYFEENRGQADPELRFIARARGYTAYFSPSETVFVLPTSVPDGGGGVESLRLRFVDANAESVVGRRPLSGRSHYFIGQDEDEWIHDVRHFGGVVQHDVWEGVDAVWRDDGTGRLEYDLVLAPGVPASVVRLAYDGGGRPTVDEAGSLVIETPGGVLRQSAPRAYQEIRGCRVPVSASFRLLTDGRVGFRVGGHDARRPLVIDPVVSYASYYGGSGSDDCRDIAIDSTGALYVVGQTGLNFPTKSPYQATFGGWSWDGIVLKLNPSGSAVVYATYLGGSGASGGQGNDHCKSIEVDSSGNAYIVGTTNATDFPVQSALQGTYGGGTSDVFLTKLNAAGSALVFSTYHGGSQDEDASEGSLALDSTGAVYIAGTTRSADFPIKAAIQSTLNSKSNTDLFLSKINSAGSALVYSTFYGGTGSEELPWLAVDSTGAAYVAAGYSGTDFPLKGALQSSPAGGTDFVLAKFNAAGSASVYSTYLGGGGLEHLRGGVAVDATGAAYLCGKSESSDFPLKSAYQGTLSGTSDAVISKLNAAGSALVYSTYLGGGAGENVGGFTIDSSGRAYVTGNTSSSDFPLKSPLSGSSTLNGSSDVYVSCLNAQGSALLFSTYFGGSGGETGFGIAVSGGGIYVGGGTTSTDLPLTNAVQSTHGGSGELFVLKTGSPAPPQAPGGLTVAGSSASRVDLAWTDATGETNYELERKTEAGAFGALAEPAANATSYADESVTGDTTYTYRIRAINDNGASEWSNEAQVVTIDSPDQLTADAVSNARIDLMWRDRSGSEDGFEVERKRAGADDYAPLDTLAAGVTSLADNSVAPEATYSYRVRATKGGGASGWSNVAEVTTPPADPADVIPNTRSDTEVRITWKDLSAAETGYEIERGVGCPAPSFARIVTVGPDVVEYTDRGALPETTYSYRVRAVNEHGHSEYTAPVCITTAPVAPSGFGGTAASPSRIRLAWSDNSSIEKGYEVQRTVAGRDEWEDIADLPSDASEYVDVGVSQEAAFSYRVRAYDDNGRSRDAMVEGVSTPAALVVRSAKLTIPTGRAAKRKKPTLVARGEMDIGGTQVDFEGAATLWIGDTQLAIGGFDSLRRGKTLRYDEDGVRLDLKPSAKGASRVPFSLKVAGDVAAALDKDGELFLRFKSGAFDAMGVVTLAGGQFNPARGKGTWIDPELNLLSVAATPKRKSFKMRATFPPDELPATAPEVSVLLDIFEISFEPTAFKQRGATKFVLSRKLGPVRQKVVLDYRRGTLSITLNGVALQTYEPGTVLVPLAVSIGTTQLQDKPLLVVTKRSFRY